MTKKNCPPAEEHPTFDYGEYYLANVGVSDDVALYITCDNVQILDADSKKGHGMVDLGREDAIATAEAILRQYRVPFCNRVSNDTG